MRKKYFTAAAGFVLCALAFCAPSQAVNNADLSDFLSRKGVVKVYVDAIKDSSKDKKVDAADLKKEVEDALAKRKSIRFEVLPARDQADIAIEGDVSEFFWTDSDPVDMLIGLGGTAMDAATRENYARMRALIRVIDVKGGKTLWEDRVTATITSKTMTADQSVTLINEDMAKVLIREAFGKKRDRR